MALDLPSYLLGKRAGGGGKGALKIQIVDELPTTGEANVLYLVPRQVTKTRNVFDEYLYVNEAWELVGTTDIDISGKQDKMQFDSLPTASADNVGKIVQYIGTTNANYTNGYFYICLSDGGDPATYSWENINVQAGGGSSAVVITASNYNTQAIIDAVDNAFQDYLAGKPYSLFAEVHGNTSASMLLPLYFINATGTAFTVSWNLMSPEIKTSTRSGGGERAYYFRFGITLTNNHITGIANNIRLTSQEYGLTNDKGFYAKTENTIPYQPYNEFNIANKIYADTCGISNAYGAVIYNMNNSYVVDDVVAYYGSDNKTYKLYKCIQNADRYIVPSNYPNYWEEITLTADQLKLTTKEYTDKTHYENMAGYDATKTQVLKNIQGTLTWVDE